MHVRPRGALLLIALLAAAACVDRGGPDDGVAEAPEDTVALSAVAVDTSDQLAAPTAIALVGRHLVVLDGMADSAVRVLDAETGALVRSFGRKGRGPGEFVAPWAVVPVPGREREFWVYDMDLARLTRVDLAGSFAVADRNRWPALLLHSASNLNSPVWVSDSLLLSPGIFTERGRLAQMDGRGNLLRFVGEPPPGAANVPMIVRQHAYTGKASFSPERGLVVLGADHADRIEVYRPDGTLVRRWHGPANFEPAYTVARAGGTPVFAGSDALRFGYVDVAATPRHIYALYSGHTRPERPGKARFGRTVHVYDWSGGLRRVLRLDVETLAIAVSRDEKTLFASVFEPEPAIVRFRLP